MSPQLHSARDPWSVRYRLTRNRHPLDESTVRQLVDRDSPGVYAIWMPTFAVDEFRCAYVGMSGVDIRNRLLSHLRDAHNDQLHRDLRLFDGFATFSFEYTTDEREARALETALIKRLQPDCNITHNG